MIIIWLFKLVLNHLIEKFFVGLSICELISRTCFRILVSFCRGLAILLLVFLHLALLLAIVTNLNFLVIVFHHPIIRVVIVSVSPWGHGLESHDGGLWVSTMWEMRWRFQVLKLLHAWILLLSMRVLFSILCDLIAFFKAWHSLHKFLQTIMILSLVFQNVF